MVTKQDIETTGFKLAGAASNGGTLLFAYKDRFVIEYHGENFIYKKDYPEKFDKIQIKEIQLPSLKFKTLYDGKCDSEQDLKDIIKKLSI